jgi:hypothetical protein
VLPAYPRFSNAARVAQGTETKITTYIHLIKRALEVEVAQVVPTVLSPVGERAREHVMDQQVRPGMVDRRDDNKHQCHSSS